MTKVLVISGHPNLEQSNTNRVILDDLQRSELDLEVRELDALYPDYQIDIGAEQAALLQADIVVLQFPFYWYSMPALLKKWLDDVFAYDFAYGSQGDKLKDKDLILSITIGGPAESYRPLGYNHFEVEQLLRPLEQTAYLAGMHYHAPLYSHGMVFIDGVYNTLEGVQQLAHEHAQALLDKIQLLDNSLENRVQKFVKNWFEKFDLLGDDEDYFCQRLSEDVYWLMPEGEFVGHSGFRDWYRGARATFKPNCDHQVEQINVLQNGDEIQIDLRIRLLAQTHADSALKGESINLLVNETWLAHVDDVTGFKIFDYRVEPVGN